MRSRNKTANVSLQNPYIISIDGVIHTIFANLAIIFLHDLQKRKSFKVTVCYLCWNLPINAFDNFSQTVYTNENTPNGTGACITKLYRKQRNPQKYCFISLVCNFQSIKCPLELNSLLLKFFCYVTWFDERRNWRPCKRDLHFKFYSLFEIVPSWFKNYKLLA